MKKSRTVMVRDFLLRYRYIYMANRILTKEVIMKASPKNGDAVTFVYEPATIDEELFGNVYIIAWIKKGAPHLEFLPNLIASIIRREFYKSGKSDVKSRFELVLKKANAALEDVGKNNARIADEAHFSVLNLAGTRVQFSKFGNMSAFLARGGEITNMSTKFKPRAKRELFSAVVSGDILPGDRLLFGTGPVFDLFSEKGIVKLGGLPLDEQAEIITALYQKHVSDASLPSQAAVLLEIEEAKQTSVLVSKFNFGAKKVVPETKANRKKIPWRTHIRKIGIGIAFITVFAGIGTGLHRYNAGIEVLTEFSKKISQATPADLKQNREMIAMMSGIQADAARLISSWYLTDVAHTVFTEANLQMGHLGGLHQETPKWWSNAKTHALAFTPSFIFDDASSVLVFGDTLASYLVIDKKTGAGSFIFPPADAFHIERMFARDGDFYFVNDSTQSAYVWFKKENEFAPVQKTLKNILATPSVQNRRETQNAVYAVENNRIIKKDKNRESKEIFLLGHIQNSVDVAVSETENRIFILTPESIFVFPHI